MSIVSNFSIINSRIHMGYKERKEGTYKGLVAFDKDKEDIDHKAYPLSQVFDMGYSSDCYTVFCKGLFHPHFPRIVVEDRKA